MTEFTKQDVEKIAYEIWENSKYLPPDECWNKALYIVNWLYISKYQKLSENTIREFKDNVNWYDISLYQKLSENFIREFKDKVKWDWISISQNLSEDFIREFKDKVNWNNIFIHQKLSETFIKEFKDKVNWNWISEYQKLSEEFIKEFNLVKPDNWLYIPKEEKLNTIKQSNLYEIIDDTYIIAYKSTRSGYSIINFQYYYEVGKVYEAHCDCNLNNYNSFGLSAWTKERALDYYNDEDVRLFRVKIHIDDLGAFIQNNHGKLRCFKLEVIEQVEI
jgi:hypothetical protein